jgi:hypothetical protein
MGLPISLAPHPNEADPGEADPSDWGFRPFTRPARTMRTVAPALFLPLRIVSWAFSWVPHQVLSSLKDQSKTSIGSQAHGSISEHEGGHSRF